MLAPAAWLKHQSSKERGFPPRAEILAEMLLISSILSPDTAAQKWEEAQVTETDRARLWPSCTA